MGRQGTPLIEFDDIYWIFENDPGIVDVKEPFSGLHEPRLPTILSYYESWARAAHALQEGKMIGAMADDDSMFDTVMASWISSMPDAEKHVRREYSRAKKVFEQLMSEAETELLDLLYQYQAEKISFAGLQKETEDWFRFVYPRVYEMGRSASGVGFFAPEISPVRADEKEWIDNALKDDLSYWRKFLREIKDGQTVFSTELSPTLRWLVPPKRRHTVEERCTLYLKSMKSVFEHGRVAAMPNDLLFYWIGPKLGEKGLCAGCAFVIEHMPYTKKTLPALPGAFATPCGFRCRHKLMVRRVPLEEVKKREAVLPPRKQMVETLNAILRSRGKYKVKGAGDHPWVQR